MSSYQLHAQQPAELDPGMITGQPHTGRVIWVRDEMSALMAEAGDAPLALATVTSHQLVRDLVHRSAAVRFNVAATGPHDDPHDTGATQ